MIPSGVTVSSLDAELWLTATCWTSRFLNNLSGQVFLFVFLTVLLTLEGRINQTPVYLAPNINFQNLPVPPNCLDISCGFQYKSKTYRKCQECSKANLPVFQTPVTGRPASSLIRCREGCETAVSVHLYLVPSAASCTHNFVWYT